MQLAVHEVTLRLAPDLDQKQFRPSASYFANTLPRNAIAAAPIGILVIANAVVLARQPGSLAITAVLLAAFILGSVAWYGSYLLNVRLVLGESEIRYIDRFRRLHVHPKRDTAGVALRSLVWPGIPPRELVIIYTKDHRCLLRLPRMYWQDSDVQAIRAEIGSGRSLNSSRTRADELEKEFEGATTLIERHNWLVGTFGAVLAIIVGTIILKYLRIPA